MRPINDIAGKIFGRITVISRAQNPGTRKNDTAAYWNCKCECGNIVIMRGYSLTSGRARSCGCLKLEAPHLEQFSKPIYSPEIAIARIIWQQRYHEELPFDDFYRIILRS